MQNPNNPYAALVPIFCNHFLHGTQPTFNGDSETSRDFTFVENAVQANIRAMLVNADVLESILHRPALRIQTVFNVACGEQISLNQLVVLLREISGKNIEAIYDLERVGDVRHSKASIEKFKVFCAYVPKIKFKVRFG